MNDNVNNIGDYDRLKSMPKLTTEQLNEMWNQLKDSKCLLMKIKLQNGKWINTRDYLTIRKRINQAYDY